MDLKSNEPFWLVKNGLIASYPSLRTDESCDVLVVGGGITGALIAHQCIKDGYSTILVDQREIANGSSSATTSMLQYEIDTPLYKLIDMIGSEGAVASYTACSVAIDQLEIICKEIKSDAGFRKKKSLYFAEYKKDELWLKKEYDARKSAGFKVSWLEQKQVEKQFGLSQTQGGICSDQGASIDAFKLVHELLIYNINKGLQVYDKTKLENVRHNSRTNMVTFDTGGSVKAKKIVYCVGYESASMIPEKFVDLISTYAIVSEVNQPLTERFKDVLLWNTSDPYNYFRTTDDGRLLIGGEDESFRDPPKRDALIDRKNEKLLKSFYKYLPKEQFYVDFSWAGTFGETKDGLPYIGVHEKYPNSYFVLGFGGNGITFSVTGMEMVSAWLSKKKHPLEQWFRFGR